MYERTGTRNPNWRGGKQQTQCEHCGATLYRERNQLARCKHTFCNQQCKHLWMSQKVKVTCEVCGTEVMRTPSFADKSQHHFCGTACAGVFQARVYASQRPVLPCQICGKDIPQKKPSKRVQLCSRECQGKWVARQLTGKSHPMPKLAPRITITCKQCGKTRAVTPCHQNHPFCNKRCYGDWKMEHVTGANNPNYKGYQDYYGPNWYAQKRAARKRDGYACRRCGLTQKKLGRALDVHHLQPFRTFGYIPGQNDNYLRANELTNLISLCPACHKLVENGAAVQPYLL